MIQAILRHSNIATTQNIYIKSVPADAVTAMKHLEMLMAANNLATGSEHHYGATQLIG